MRAVLKLFSRKLEHFGMKPRKIEEYPTAKFSPLISMNPQTSFAKRKLNMNHADI